jgi:hypothetical protein
MIVIDPVVGMTDYLAVRLPQLFDDMAQVKQAVHC